MRTELLLEGVAPDSRILEIGPSHAPLAPKRAGWRTKTVDHLPREALVAKYDGHPDVDTSRIEDVDFVWSGGQICDAVPRDQWGQFDALIASHVIEHVPDLIGFLNSAEKLLAPDGKVVLAVPDKRYCFDFFQPVSTTGQVLAAHAEKRSRHTPSLAYDYYAYTAADGNNIAFGHAPRENLRLVHTLEEAVHHFGTIATDPEYLDIHGWRFTPSSFELILLEIAILGLSDLRVERITPPSGFEFYVWLRSGGKAEAAATQPDVLTARRMLLLKRGLLELRQQIDCLV